MNRQTGRKFDGELEDLVYGRLFDFETDLQLIPSAATLEVGLSDGTPLLSLVGSIDSVGIISYDWTTTESDLITSIGVPSFDHRCQWSFTVGAETIERVQYFDVPIARLITRVKDLDLVNQVPALAEFRQTHRGRVSSATASSITDDRTLSGAPSNFWRKSMLIHDDVRRVVTQYDSQTLTLDLDLALPNVPDVNDPYLIEKSYDYQITKSWQNIQTRLKLNFGQLDYGKVLDGLDLSEVHLHLATSMACESRQMDRPDLFERLSENELAKFVAALQQLNTKISSDTAGVDRAVHTWIWGK